MHVYLETPRLILRRFTADDVDNMVDLDGDPAVMRYITGGRPTPRDEIRDDILPAFLSYYEPGEGFGFWAAIEKSTGDFLGWFHFRPPPGGGPDNVELGYRLRRSAWGRGYATEGSRAIIRKGFAELGVRRVFAETMAVNLASRRVMEKAGLRLVRAFHQPWPYPIEGDEHGDVEYALLRDEWARSHTAGAPTLVFLHGVGLSRRLWRPQLTALADFPCLAPDLPEHGENWASDPFTLDGAAHDVAALIRMRATGGRAHVVGLSLGGAVALTLLRLAPEVVQSVLVSGVAAPLPRPVRGMARVAAGAAAVVPRGLLATAATLPVRLPWGPYAVPAPDRAALCSDLRRSFTPSFVHHVALALAELEPPAVASAPVLVLVGGRELWGSRAAAGHVVGCIQGARGGVVPGVGHLWNLQAPDLFVAILRAWVGGGALPPAVQPL